MEKRREGGGGAFYDLNEWVLVKWKIVIVCSVQSQTQKYFGQNWGTTSFWESPTSKNLA